MKDLFIKSLAGQFEMLTDVSTTRKSGINNQKTISISGVLTSQNQHAFPLIQNENSLIYDEEEYVIKTSSIKPFGNKMRASATAVHRMFVDLDDMYIYDVIAGEKALSIDTMLKFALAGTGYSYQVDSEGIAKSVTVENFGDAKSLTLLNSIAEKFGVEYECVNKTIYIAKEIARYTDNQLRYSFNINNPSKDIDTSSLKTYIRGFGKKKEDGTYVVTAEYRSPLADVFGPRHADPVRDERYTDKASLLERIKSELHDRIDISISLTYVELQAQGIQDIRKGDYVWCIVEPFDIDVRIRVVEVEDYSDSSKSPKFTLGSITRKSTDIVSDFKRAQKTISKIVDVSTGKIREGSIKIGGNTSFDPGYDPTKLNIPQYGLASASANGLMSSADYVKLANILVGPDGQVVVALASDTNDGLMSAVDFTKLKRIKMPTTGEIDMQSILDRLTALEQEVGGQG
ncbi:phage tail protein [Bacillus haynesii]|uniref:phage tail protein n=1 Tax=Bacillus haynesii TaxID=1925021 RepID=UPI00227E2545|nr:phage tail protein [Bacillus haynesii]MCY8265614.1 phage tail protein [Bacillus haynesii]MCY8570404.1 phage tail protein [Bacillus haynesii]MCY9451604.1 phage tail protein [Bacillus haynesii]MEC1507106.1 phage tail protein [Bacillus haynesii]